MSDPFVKVLGDIDPIAARHPSGAIMIDGMHVADTMTCKHCGHTWIPVKGSGKVRGWCMKCNGPTCGHPACDECKPFEQQLTEYEKGVLKSLR
jgi:hypothetical protein